MNGEIYPGPGYTRERVAGPLSSVRFDESGYLVDPEDWTPDVAEALAANAGIQLTPTQWKVLAACREEHARTGQSPGLGRMAELTGIEMRVLYRMFPGGPATVVARLAGLSRPADPL